RKQALALGSAPAALALGADSRRRPRLGAGAAARRAHLARRHRDRHLRAPHRLVEADRHFGLDVPAALGPRPLGAPATLAGSATEQVAEQVGDVEVRREATARLAGAATATHPEQAAAVVLLALVGVAQHVVGRRDLLEALLGLRVPRVAVGVVLPCKLAVRLL